MKRKMSTFGVFLVFALVLFSGGFMGCATTQPGAQPTQTTWQQTATDTYTLMGTVLATGKTTMDTLAAAGQISPDQQAKFNDVYKIAYDAYQTTGELLQTAIETIDAQKQAGNIAAFNTAMAKLPALVTMVTNLVGEVQKK
jgi:hypothetical protein